MCGIAGLVTAQPELHRQALSRMVATLHHRGPDGHASQKIGPCWLGHTRLKIVDLETGAQPMTSIDGATTIVFNGEIYGYRDIRRNAGDYAFATRSDTETILYLYQRYGEAMLDHLPGMFAFALWDHPARKLFCARDRFGEKPFFYASGEDGTFVFASEIKAILASELIEPVISRASFNAFLRWGYLPPDTNVFANIHTLPPGHSLTLSDGSLTVKRYWKMPEHGPSLDLEEATARFRQLFEGAVSRQLVADVPVGAFLSGGLDSSTVAIAASRHKPGLSTYAFGFEGAFNELPFARTVATQQQTHHVELGEETEVRADLLFTMREVYDEPFADSSNIPTYLLCRLARRHGKVILTGDGADELLGGYDWLYQPLLFAGRGRRRHFWQGLLLSILARLRRQRHYPLEKLWGNVRRGANLKKANGSVLAAHQAQKSFFSTDEWMRLSAWEPPKDNTPAGKSDTVADAMRWDIAHYLAGDILVKTDRAAMAHGLELRCPFLDVDLASFCLSLPWRVKLNAVSDKILLRQAYAHEWPAPIRTRRKQGFGADVHAWLQRKDFAELKQSYLADSAQRLYDLIDYQTARIFAERDNHQTWLLLNAAIWLETHAYSSV